MSSHHSSSSSSSHSHSSSTIKQKHTSTIPHPRHGTQIRYLFQNKTPEVIHLREKFITKFIRSTIMRDCPKQFTDNFINEIRKILNDPNLMTPYNKFTSRSKRSSRVLEDDVIYYRLNLFYQKELAKSKNISCSNAPQKPTTSTPTTQWTRADNRLKYIEPLLADYKAHITATKTPIHYLDIGCNEGNITTAIGKYLNATTISGCDIAPPPSPPPFDFHLLQPHEYYTLSHYPTASKNFITTFMSLHHISDIHQELDSIHRILKPDGIFLIREHDLNNDYLRLVIDVIHSFYDLVTKPQPTSIKPTHPPSFRTYFANYYSQKELIAIIESHGFKFVSSTPPIGLWRHYQAMFIGGAALPQAP